MPMVRVAGARHLRNEIGFFEIILKMNEVDAKAFLDWYLSHPYHIGTREVLAIVTGTNRAISEDRPQENGPIR